MTLKDTLRQNLTGHLSNEKTEVDVNIAEKIAEDFALEFGKWLNNKVINPSGKHHNLLGIVKVDTLLVIFKKEKGL
jgi:hypothetical protein